MYNPEQNQLGRKERVAELKRQLTDAMRTFGIDHLSIGYGGETKVFVRFDQTGTRIIEFGGAQDYAAVDRINDSHINPYVIVFKMNILVTPHEMPDGTTQFTEDTQFPDEPLERGDEISIETLSLFNEALNELNVEMRATVN